MEVTVIIMPGLLQDYIVLSDNVILISPEYAKKLISG